MKPGKIVSGQEADKTNEMLQVLANIVINKVDTADAVMKVKNGEKPGKGKKIAAKDDKKGREKSKSPVKTPSKKESTPTKKDRENKENKVEKENNKNRSPSVKSRKEPMKSPKKTVNGHKEEPENKINNNNNNESELITNGLVQASETEPLTNGNTDHDDVDPVIGNHTDAKQSPTEEESPAPTSRPKTAARPVTSKERRKPMKSSSPDRNNGSLSKQNSVEADHPQVLGKINNFSTYDRNVRFRFFKSVRGC